MDELKHKVLGFLQKQGKDWKVPPMGFTTDSFALQSSSGSTLNNSDIPIDKHLSVNSKTASNEFRPDDQVILDSIEDIYFTTDENFDASKYVLNKIISQMDSEHIAQDFNHLKIQQQCVSKKVLNLILQQQSACSDQLKVILELKEHLDEIVDTCQKSRNELRSAKNQFIYSLSILSNYRKRQILRGLMHSLNTIKTLHSTEDRLQELLNEGNYPTAIILLNECISVASVYRHFTCIAALSRKLQEILEMTEEQLDEASSAICYNFNAESYAKLHSAYNKLGKSQMAIDQLNMHFMSAIHNSAFNVIHKYAASENENTSKGSNNETVAAKKQYKQLCACVPRQEVISCLIELCKSLWIVLSSYHRIYRWHSKTDDRASDTVTVLSDCSGLSPWCNVGDIVDTDVVSGVPDFEDTLNKQYIKQKLENGLTKIWFDVQSKVSTFVLNCDLVYYQFDQFVQVLSIVHRLIEVGEEFCNSKSEELQEAMHKQSENYIKNYHLDRIEELRIFLENESWEVCPVNSKFEILHLQEFKFLRSSFKSIDDNNSMNATKRNSNSVSTNLSDFVFSSSRSSEDGDLSESYFVRFDRNLTPFDGDFDESLVGDDLYPYVVEGSGDGYRSDDTESENEELRKDYVDENPQKSSNARSTMKPKYIANKTFLLANTTLTLLRQIGKYLQMSRLLKPISFDIFICLTQLFDYYLYSVHNFFTSDLKISSGGLYTIKLNSALKRISEHFAFNIKSTSIQQNEEIAIPPIQNKTVTDRTILKPKLSVAVDIRNGEDLHGLAARIVAVESVIFIAKQFETLKFYLENLVPSENKHAVQHFFNQTIPVASDLRKPVYMAVASQAFDLKQTLVNMSKVNWEIREVVSEHCAYIDVLLREIQVFSMRLSNVSTKLYFPEEIYYHLWENIAHLVSHTLVEGFSNPKKCSSGGRALMQLDFAQLMTKFEKITSVRPMPHREYVETYIKAYYHTEDTFESFIREHSEYSSKHMIGLICCAPQINKKTRQRLFTLIEEIDKSR